MIEFITTPDATSTFANIGTWSSSMFDNFQSVMYMIIGFLVGGLLVSALIAVVVSAISNIVNRGSKYE